MKKSRITLQSLINEDKRAHVYFSTLPDYIRSSIEERGDNIHSFTELRNYADNLLSGDK